MSKPASNLDLRAHRPDQAHGRIRTRSLLSLPLRTTISRRDLVLRRCGRMPHAQRRQDRFDIGRAQPGRVALAVEIDKGSNPVAIHLLGAEAVVPDPDPITNPIEQLNRRSIPYQTGLFGPPNPDCDRRCRGLCASHASVIGSIPATHSGGIAPLRRGEVAPITTWTPARLWREIEPVLAAR